MPSTLILVLPNVLFITVDQWRGDCLGSLEHPVVQTPNLDALAERGVMFSKHYAQCAPCGPSRASLHTGLYMHAHRSVDNGTPLDSRFTNMAIEVRELGYDPVLFGYTDTTLDPRTLAPGDPALTTYESVLPGYRTGVALPTEQEPWIGWLDDLGYDVSVGRTELHHPGGSIFGPPTYAAEHTDTAYMTDLVIDEIDRSDDGWFVHASYLRPHAPFVVAEPYHSMFDPADMPAPRRRPTSEEESAVHPIMEGFVRAGLAVADDPDSLARWQAIYFAMMAEVDTQLGRLFEQIDFDNTLVVVVSDHGEMLGDHWLQGKLGYYPESFHVPLIIAGPGIESASQPVSHFTENIDLFPTIIDLIGGQIPSQCQGRSLRPFLEGSPPSGWRDAAHWEWDFRTTRPADRDPEAFNLAVIHDDEGTYVHFAGERPLFFDLTDDPDHFVDRSRDPAWTDRTLDYAGRLLSWRMQTDFGELVNINAIA
ncbi:MAG: alkaline phosphatase family protein [Actinomycetia bacterium]|nr:alkaline phosphatase family protein [Actinomycetes bacterium]MCP4959771.1 alkaline phosphatase family protein [Actinomycetes bacterium]